MKYFIVAGEASGDLHASNLMASIKQKDPEADFCFLGGDLMQAQGGKMIRHYRNMAFMGIIPVLMNLKTVLGNMKSCTDAIKEYSPDVVILVDYPSFNLKIARFVKENLKDVPVFYYIAPKLWAWKEYRLKQIKKYVDRVFSILPFEVEWFGERGYKVDYVGNPCMDAVQNMKHKNEPLSDFLQRNNLEDKPIIAILPGSRLQEITGSLPKMVEAASEFKEYQIVVSGAPAIDKKVYSELLTWHNAKVVYNETYELLQQATAAVVVSGTAALEAALIGTPQVVVYQMNGGKLFHEFLKLFIKVPYVSLANLIAKRWMIKELIIEDFTVENMKREITELLKKEKQEEMKKDYQWLRDTLGYDSVSDKAATLMLDALQKKMLSANAQK